MKGSASFLWFLSSYAPLWVILAIRFEPAYLRISMAVLAIVSTVVLMLIINRGKKRKGENDPIYVVGDGGADISGYIAAYLLPFVTLSTPGLSDLVAYVVFIGVAGSVYLRSGLMQVNPTVYLFGWKVLRGSMPVDRDKPTNDEAVLRFEKEVFVLTRSNHRIGDRTYAEQFSDRVYLDHGDCDG